MKKKNTVPTKTFYAVVPKNFEYNDEVYNHEGYARPTKIFASKQKAEQECLRQDLETIKQEPDFISNLCYSIDDLLSNTTFVESFGVNPNRRDEWPTQLEKAIENFTISDLKRFMNDMNFSLSDVVEVAIDDDIE